MVERRRQPRLIIKKQVVLNHAISATGLDLSEGGMYVHTGRNFPVGGIVIVSLPMDGGTLIISAQVRHSKPGVGMGLMFLDMALDRKYILCEFLKRQNIGACKQIRKNVLIMDGNATTRKVYGSKIILEGFRVFDAENRPAAMGVIEEEQVDLVLLDPYQPGAGGLEVVSQIRTRPGMETVPILVLSAISSSADREKAIKIGATELLPKILTSPAKLTERIKFYLN